MTDRGQPEHEEPVDMQDLVAELEELAETAPTAARREEIEMMIEIAYQIQPTGTFGRLIRGFDRADMAEAFLGSVVFGIPMIIEGGSLEVGAFIATHPIYMISTLLLGVATVIGLLYVADIQHVVVHRPFFGVIPRRLVGVLGISFGTAFVLMTGWGRVDWSTPWIAFSQILFVFVGMAIGAALGDILPGS
ncbi:MAG: DUF2391 domain-containing protein [Halobacteriales archaeon]|nr:DUF2391 domain-containing protein [Halobacteriales archaeon]